MKRWLAAVFGATTVAVGCAVWVGYNIHPHGFTAFNWDLFAAVGTAAGTTLLATLTGTLAVVTWGDVQASRRIAETAGQERRARERPIVLLEHVAIATSQGAVTLVLRFRNAGEGAAVRGSIQVGFAPPGANVTHPADGYLTSLMPGEERSGVKVDLNRPAAVGLTDPPNWRISGIFLDAAGNAHSLLDGQAAGRQQRLNVVEGPV